MANHDEGPWGSCGWWPAARYGPNVAHQASSRRRPQPAPPRPALPGHPRETFPSPTGHRDSRFRLVVRPKGLHFDSVLAPSLVK